MGYNSEAFKAAVLRGDHDFELPAPEPVAPAVGLPKRNKGLMGDLGTSLKRGIEEVPGTVTGLLDIPVNAVTGHRYVGQATDALGAATGFQPGKWAEKARGEYSDAHQQAQATADAVWDDPNAPLLAKIGATMSQPRLIAGAVAESLPTLGEGAIIGRGLVKGGMSVAKAAGVGEGAVTAGQQMDQSQTEGRMSSLAALGAGVTTGVIGAAGTKIANRLGFETAESALIGGGVKGEAKGLTKRMLGGAVTEGVLQELPQSATEQMWSNFEAGKPLFDGAIRAGVEGGLAGMVMGAGANMAAHRDALPKPTDTNEDLAAKVDSHPALAGLIAQAQDLNTPADTGGLTPEELAAMPAAAAARAKGGAELDQFEQGLTKMQHEATRQEAKDAWAERLRLEDAPAAPAAQMDGIDYEPHTAPVEQAITKHTEKQALQQERAQKAQEKTQKAELKGIEAKLLAQADELATTAQHLGVPEGQLPSRIGEVPGDKKIPAQGRVMLARQHVAKLQQLIAQREAEIRQRADLAAGDRNMDYEARRAADLVNKITPKYKQQETQHGAQPEGAHQEPAVQATHAAEGPDATTDQARTEPQAGAAETELGTSSVPEEGQVAESPETIWDEAFHDNSDPESVPYAKLSQPLKERWEVMVEAGKSTYKAYRDILRTHRNNTISDKFRLTHHDVDGMEPAAYQPIKGVHTPTSRQRVRMAIEDLVPDAGNRVTVVNDVSELTDAEQRIFADGRAAAYVPQFVAEDGTTKGGFAIMVANRLNQGEERGVFLHEIGVHAALNPTTIQKLSDKVRLWAKDGRGATFESGWAQNVINEVDTLNRQRIASGQGPMSDTLRRHEEIALFVQRMVENGVDPTATRQANQGIAAWFKDLLNALRDAMKKLYTNPDAIRAQDVVDLVTGAAASVSQAENQSVNGAQAFGGASPAFTRPDYTTPVGGVIDKALQWAKDAAVNATTRKAALGWATMHHIVKVYADTDTGWKGKLQAVWKEMQAQDGRMNALRVLSGSVDKQFHEFEQAASAASPIAGSKVPFLQDFYQFMQDTSMRRMDPRLELSGKSDGAILRPLDEQPRYVKAQKELASAQAALNEGGKDTTQRRQDVQDAQATVEALAAAHKAIEAHYAAFAGKTPQETAAVKANYLRDYQAVARKWKAFGALKSKDGKSRPIAQELYDSAERHLKSLGRQELEATVSSWYELFYAPKPGVEKATTPSAMLAQMRDGRIGGDAGSNFVKNVYDPSFAKLYQGPYFHNARWGKFYVRYTDAHGDVVREHFESERDYKQAVETVNQLVKDGQATAMTAGLQADDIKREATSNRQIQAIIAKAEAQIRSDPELDKEVADAQAKLMRDTLYRAYVESLPETSTRSMRLQRQNIAGASTEMRRAFAKRAEAAHVHIAMSEHMPRITQHMRDMEVEIKQLENGAHADGETEPGDPHQQVIARNVADEVKKRLRDLAEQPDTPLLDRLSGVNHAMYLAGNPAYLLTNMLQPFQFASVIGAKFGVMKAARTLVSKGGKAMAILKEAGKGEFFDPHLDFAEHLRQAETKGDSAGLSLEEWKMLDDLNKMGKLDVTLARELGAMSAAGGNHALGKTSEAIRKVGALGHYSEAFNRITTALAAYELARKGNAGNPPMDHAQATEYARNAVDESQLNYSGINKARMMGKHGIIGAATPLVMAFKSFQMQVLELHVRTLRQALGKGNISEAQQKEAQKQLAGMLGMTAVLAGTMGLPFASAIAALANAGGDDDEDVRNKYRNMLADAFGPEMGGMLANGLPRMAGVDVQGNVGLQDLLPFSKFLSDRREFKDKVQGLANDSSGAFVGLAEKSIGGLAKVLDGQVMEGLQDMLPKALASPVKGAELAADGKFKDSKGNLLPMESSAWDALLTGLNFKPADKGDRDTANRYYRSQQYLGGKDLAKIHKAYNSARQEGDREAMQEAIGQLREYNTAHPDKRVALQTLESSYRSLLKQEMVASASGTGILASPKDRRQLTEYDWGVK